MSDVILNDDDTISLVGTVVAPLHVNGSAEITSSGDVAGFAFMDRSHPNQRWVLYAKAGMYTFTPTVRGDKATYSLYRVMAKWA